MRSAQVDTRLTQDSFSEHRGCVNCVNCVNLSPVQERNLKQSYEKIEIKCSGSTLPDFREVDT